eukprot:1161096-Pelagomonas_calceolata.AAC.6
MRAPAVSCSFSPCKHEVECTNHPPSLCSCFPAGAGRQACIMGGGGGAEEAGQCRIKRAFVRPV